MSRVNALAPEVNRVLFVRNLPYKITAEELYNIFGRYGALRQVRVGSTGETKGTAFVVYEDIYDAKSACEHLSGFAVGGRYLVLHYYLPSKAAASAGAVSLVDEAAEVEALRRKVRENEEAAAAAGGGGGGGEGEGELDEEAERRRVSKMRASYD